MSKATKARRARSVATIGGMSVTHDANGDYVPEIVDAIVEAENAVNAAEAILRKLKVSGKVSASAMQLAEASAVLALVASYVREADPKLDGATAVKEALRLRGLKGYSKTAAANDARRTHAEETFFTRARKAKSRYLAALELKTAEKRGGARKGAGRKGKNTEEANTTHHMSAEEKMAAIVAGPGNAPVETSATETAPSVPPAPIVAIKSGDSAKAFALVTEAKTITDWSRYLLAIDEGIARTVELSGSVLKGRDAKSVLVREIVLRIHTEIERLKNVG